MKLTKETLEKIKKEVIIEFIDELIDQCYPYDDFNNDSVISEERLKEIKNKLEVSMPEMENMKKLVDDL